MSDKKECGHAACSCPVGDEKEYCGDHCEKAAAQDIVEIACDCGHGDCE